MSLLEDIYMEDDVEIVGDLERIVEGGDEEQDNGNSDDEGDRNSQSEAEEEKPRKVNTEAEKKAKVVRNPRFVLNPARLMGPRGVHTIENFFKDFKFQGKDHEKEDLDMVMKKLEHWAHRLYPKFLFDDCIDKIESLGNKKIVQAHMRKIRLNMIQDDDGVIRQCDSDNEDEQTGPNAPEMDEFDMLLEQQIALARSTPASNMKNNSNIQNQTFNSVNKTNNTSLNNFASPMQASKVTAVSSPQMTEEQKARMMRNRMMAEERRLARMKEAMLKEKAGTQTNDKIVVAETENILENNKVVGDKGVEKIDGVAEDDVDERIKQNGIINCEDENVANGNKDKEDISPKSIAINDINENKNSLVNDEKDKVTIENQNIDDDNPKSIEVDNAEDGSIANNKDNINNNDLGPNIQNNDEDNEDKVEDRITNADDNLEPRNGVESSKDKAEMKLIVNNDHEMMDVDDIVLTLSEEE